MCFVNKCKIIIILKKGGLSSVQLINQYILLKDESALNWPDHK